MFAGSRVLDRSSCVFGWSRFSTILLAIRNQLSRAGHHYLEQQTKLPPEVWRAGKTSPREKPREVKEPYGGEEACMAWI